MTHDQVRALIDRQFADGPLPPLEDQALRAHVRGCAACRAYYDRVAELEARLGGDAAIVERLRARGLPAGGLPAEPARPRRRWIPAVALAASVAIGVGIWWGRTAPAEWGVKGGGARGAARIVVFHQAADGAVKRADGSIRAADGLLVSYTNPQGGAGYLGVVGRAEDGQLFWIQPPWTDARARPSSVAIARGVADRELPQVVHHALPTGPLEICGIFTAEARAVPEWDAALSRQWPPAGADCHRVEVAP